MRYSQAIDASGVLSLQIGGHLFLLDSTGSAASVQVEIMHGQHTFENAPGVKRGFRVSMKQKFSGVRITAPAGTVVAFFITDEIMDIGTNSSDIGIESPDTLTSYADVLCVHGAATLILAASTDTTREVSIKNLNANAAIVRIGDSLVTATRGHELAPGESLELSTRGAIYVWNTGVADQSVSVLVNHRV